LQVCLRLALDATRSHIAFLQILETFGDAFDLEQHNTTESGVLIDVENPYRAIQGWYLSDSKGNIQHLPPFKEIQHALTSDTVLHGWLQPSNKQKNTKKIKPIFCSIPMVYQNHKDVGHELAYDRTKIFRGFWIMRTDNESGNILPIYWLQEPDMSMYTEAELLPYRGFIAVASNVYDFLVSHPEAAKQTVAQVLKKYPQAFSDTLLHEYKDYCAAYLEKIVPAMTPRCTFLNSLRRLKSTATVSSDEILRLTIKAEAHAQQYPWGQAKMDENTEESVAVPNVEPAFEDISPNNAPPPPSAPTTKKRTSSHKAVSTNSTSAEEKSKKVRSNKRPTDSQFDDTKDDEANLVERKMPKLANKAVTVGTMEQDRQVGKNKKPDSKVKSGAILNQPRDTIGLPAKKRAKATAPVEEHPRPAKSCDNRGRMFQSALVRLICVVLMSGTLKLLT
jgi:hypothetical protein